VEDDLYVATLRPQRDLQLLDLTEVVQDDATEFESIDIAVHMLFLAGAHSYEISRAIASAANAAGLDGIVSPSYFSVVRTGRMPIETAYGISLRRFKGHEAPSREANVILSLFRPQSQHGINARCPPRRHIAGKPGNNRDNGGGPAERYRVRRDDTEE
jgi:hypothetical protein